MGTTAEKGAYIIETKSLLKDKINNLGGSIDNNTTFRNYANQLQTIYDNLPKTSYQEGTEVNLGVTTKGKLDYDNGVVGIGQSSQATRQYINVGTWEQGGINGTTGRDETASMVRTGYIEVKTGVLYSITRSITTQYMVFRFYDSNQNYLGNQQTSGMVTTNRFGTDNRMVASVGDMTMTINNTNVAYMRMVDASNDLSTIYTIYTDNTPSPSYPQQIKSVTGTQDVVVSGKNYVDINSKLENALITTTAITSGTYTLLYHKLKAGTYTISSNTNMQLVYCFTDNAPTTSTTGISRVVAGFIKKETFTIAQDCYITYRILFYNGSTLDSDVDLQKINNEVQLETGSDRTTYEPYITPTSYQLSLGEKKLYNECYIVGSPDNWKFVDNRKKLVFNGSEDWALNYNQSMFRTPVADVKYAPGGSVVAKIKSNYYTAQSYTPLYEKQIDYGIAIGTTGNDYIYIRNNDITSVADFKTWLGTHNTEAVYETRQPIETPITDETLISQLNAWYNAHSNNGTTIITSNGNLPMIIKVRALKGE